MFSVLFFFIYFTYNLPLSILVHPKWSIQILELLDRFDFTSVPKFMVFMVIYDI